MMLIKTYIDKSPIHGLGLFSGESVPAGALIWKYTPGIDIPINEEQIIALNQVQQEFMRMYTYHDNCMGTLILCGDNARHTNFSSNPNMISINNKMESYAAYDINIGDELTFPIHEDYAAYIKIDESAISSLIEGYEICTDRFCVKRDKDNINLYAVRKFCKDELILTMAGSICSSNELRGRYGNSKYLQIGINSFLGPSGGIDDYINHSCAPSSYIKIGNTIDVIALDEIEIGDKITIDYSTTWKNKHESTECNCGSYKCRKRYGNFSEIEENLQQAYIKIGIIPDYVLY